MKSIKVPLNFHAFATALQKLERVDEHLQRNTH